MRIYCSVCCEKARKEGKQVEATEHTIAPPPKEYLTQSTVGRGGKTDYWQVTCTVCGDSRVGDLSHD